MVDMKNDVFIISGKINDLRLKLFCSCDLDFILVEDLVYSVYGF